MQGLSGFRMSFVKLRDRREAADAASCGARAALKRVVAVQARAARTLDPEEHARWEDDLTRERTRAGEEVERARSVAEPRRKGGTCRTDPLHGCRGLRKALEHPSTTALRSFCSPFA